MPKPLSNSRRQILVQMESLLGNECYNASIQNYGPGGVREASGRGFRYPVTLRMPDGGTTKVRETSIPSSVSSDIILSGFYAFGANQLDVMRGLNRILQHLEKHHGLVVEDQSNTGLQTSSDG